MNSILQWFNQWLGRVNLELAIYNLIRTVIILVITKILIIAANRFVAKIFNFKKLRGRVDDRRSKTLAALLHSLIRYLLNFVAFITIMQLFGLPVGSVLTTAGIAGVAIAFGAQNFVRDIIAGFFILFEDQFGVGDQVGIADVSGIVEEIGLRTTRVRDSDGQLHIIPNGKIERVTNYMGSAMLAKVDIPLNYHEDYLKAVTILEEILDEYNRSHPFLVETARCLGIESLKESAIIIRVIARTKAREQWAVERELRKVILEGFAGHDIKFATAKVGEV